MEQERKPTVFEMRVYEAVAKIPLGKVSTYGDIARGLSIASPRAIGQALRRNPFAPEIPCHRVVSSDGKIGGFYGETSGALIDKKIAMLQAEGVIFLGNCVDFSQSRHGWE